jgi:hypothetical protein
MNFDRELLNRVMAALFGIALALITVGNPTWAYQETAVVDGGTLAGKVTLSGGKPTPRGFNLVTFPDPVYCGRISNGHGFRLLPEFAVDKEQGVKDVVVALIDVQQGKPFDFATPRIQARDCRFIPFVMVVRNHAPIQVVNMDPVMHDIQAYETSKLGPRVLFNVPLPINSQLSQASSEDAEYNKHIAGQPIRESIAMGKGRRIFVMQCGFHAFMESWGFAVDNPYYAQTDESGRFTISDVPPGAYKLVVWHPHAQRLLEQEVTIRAKSETTENFELQARKGARAGMEAVEHPRFGLGMLGDREIKPTLELQHP